MQPVAEARIAIVDLPGGLATRDRLGDVQRLGGTLRLFGSLWPGREMSMCCTGAPPVPETNTTCHELGKVKAAREHSSNASSAETSPSTSCLRALKSDENW